MAGVGLRASRRHQAVIALCVALMAAGCGSQSGSHSNDRASVDAATAQATHGMPAFFPSSGLRLAGAPDLVLVEGKHGVQLTLAEYNARAEGERLLAGLDTLSARRTLLDRLIDYKVAAAEARLRGYSAEQARNTMEEERELAQQILKHSIEEAASISDDEARAYAQAHADRFNVAERTQLGDSGFSMHVKYVIQNERLRDQLAAWQQREAVVVHRDRFEPLARAGLSPTALASAADVASAQNVSAASPPSSSAHDQSSEATKEPRP